MKRFSLEVEGDFACFTRPEMKAERVSYDVMTPSAARAIFEAILWKPAIRWQPERIEVLAPVRWVNLRRNEVGARISTSNIISAMQKGSGNLGLYIEDERQQRAGLFLRDVRYRLTARMEMTGRAGREDNPQKFMEMFQRRASKGQCINQPYLGCREFACHFRLLDEHDVKSASSISRDENWMPSDKQQLGIGGERDLGWMLYDMDYTNPANPAPRFFKPSITNGAINIPDWNSEEIRG